MGPSVITPLEIFLKIAIPMEKVYDVSGIPDQHPVGVSCFNKNSTPV